MRIWDIPPQNLCRQHLLGEHRELHGLWNVLTVHGGRGGYSRHPETRRWEGKLRALFLRHEGLAGEMRRRGYNHNSHLDESAATGAAVQNNFIDLPARQKEILQGKGCGCLLRGIATLDRNDTN